MTNQIWVDIVLVINSRLERDKSKNKIKKKMMHHDDDQVMHDDVTIKRMTASKR